MHRVTEARSSQAQVGGLYPTRLRLDISQLHGRVEEGSTFHAVVPKRGEVKIGLIEFGIGEVGVTKQRAMQVRLRKVSSSQTTPNELRRHKFCTAKANTIQMN